MFHAALEAEMNKRGRGEQARLAKQVNKTPSYITSLLARRAYGSESVRREIATALGYHYEDFLDLGRQVLMDRGETIGEGIPRTWKFDQICTNVVLLGEIADRPEIKLEDYYAAPLVDGKIAAGPGRVIQREDVKSSVWIYAPALRDRMQHHITAVQIDPKTGGESMIPTLRPGDIVLIDHDEPQTFDQIVNGKIYAIRTGPGEEDGCSIKRIFKGKRELLIVSDNASQSPPVVAWTDDVRKLIIGRVVWGWRNLLDV